MEGGPALMGAHAGGSGTITLLDEQGREVSLEFVSWDAADPDLAIVQAADRALIGDILYAFRVPGHLLRARESGVARLASDEAVLNDARRRALAMLNSLPVFRGRRPRGSNRTPATRRHMWEPWEYQR